ncbi:MAG: hypothetical protein II664_03130, partial [Oscillospiraceae bacterium]|nr:hypothetical protein [Oscillospiraceae bacterium]
MVASLIGLIFIFLVSEQHSRMLTEQLYIQKKAENDHLEKLVERRTNALRIANQQLAEAVITDALTGLYNRCEYMNQIHKRIDEAVLIVAAEKQYHPIRDYLNNLPPWDKTERVRYALHKYLGAEPSDYT